MTWDDAFMVAVLVVILVVAICVVTMRVALLQRHGGQ